jgi:hypothetical protein
MFKWILALTACGVFGQTHFETHYVLCHGIGGKESRGPSLTRATLA